MALFAKKNINIARGRKNPREPASEQPAAEDGGLDAGDIAGLATTKESKSNQATESSYRIKHPPQALFHFLFVFSLFLNVTCTYQTRKKRAQHGVFNWYTTGYGSLMLRSTPIQTPRGTLVVTPQGAQNEYNGWIDVFT